MFCRKRDVRNGWCMCPLLLTVAFIFFLVSLLDTWTSMISLNSRLPTPGLDDQSSTSMTAAARVLTEGKINNTSTNSPLWLPQQDTVDLRRFLSLRWRLHPQNAKDRITVVFPVTKSSLNDLDSNFQSILSAYSAHSLSFHELLVTCHPRIAAKVKHLIDNVRRTLVLTIPITVLLWSESDDPSSGVLHVLNSVLTTRVLLLDVTALRGIDESVRKTLFDSLPIDFAVGPHGILISPANLSCIYSPKHTTPAAYLIPPILAPTSLVMEAENGARLIANTWAALGERIVKIRRAGFGGLVLNTSMQSQPWCMNSLTSVDPIFATTFLQPFYEVLEKGTENRSLVSIRLTVLLPGQEELMSFSSTLCEMTYRGHILKIMLFSWAAADSSSNSALNMGCHLHFESIPPDMSTASLAKRLNAWTLLADFDVLMYIAERLIHTLVIEASVERFRKSRGTVVRVPTSDLPFCDWMAMLSISDWEYWHTPKIDLSVITNDRPQSLSRLLDSLTAARYYGDVVNIRLNLEQTADTETRQTVAQFRWSFGAIHVQHRIISAGLLPAVVEAWYPHDNDSYGVLLEDDVEVSPFFYAWIKIAILRYRYGVFREQARPLFGVSLYQPRNLELRVEGRVPFDPRVLFAEEGLLKVFTPYLSQVPCSWGAVYFPEHFREFHDYLALRLSETVYDISEVIVPEIRSNRWTRSWKKYFNELVYLRGYVMLYPNYDLSLATNHAEIGAHIKKHPLEVSETVRRQFDVPLMPLASSPSETRSASLLKLPGESLPAWSELPVLDLWGAITSHHEIIRRGSERHELLSGCLLRSPQFNYDAGDLLYSCTHPSPTTEDSRSFTDHFIPT